jgi:hypothetical protein
MSLVHDLVSSWVKPSQNARTKSASRVQKELEEYMRRPPRLGVGAPIPEASNACRDTARLKNQLTSGKKRARNEDDDIKQQGSFSDDEEESRASVMKKKVKVDVFDGGKKGKKINGLLTPQSAPGQPLLNLDGPPPDVNDRGNDSILPQGVSPKKKRKRHKKKKASLQTIPVETGSIQISSDTDPPSTQ